MRFRRLDLLAFGPFTDRTIDLAQGPPGLQLIYGLNEAGKSSLLRAIHGALFGIPRDEKLKGRSRDEVNTRLVVLQGVLSIVEGDHPASVEQKLSAYLDPKQRAASEEKKAA